MERPRRRRRKRGDPLYIRLTVTPRNFREFEKFEQILEGIRHPWFRSAYFLALLSKGFEVVGDYESFRKSEGATMLMGKVASGTERISSKGPEGPAPEKKGEASPPPEPEEKGKPSPPPDPAEVEKVSRTESSVPPGKDDEDKNKEVMESWGNIF